MDLEGRTANFVVFFKDATGPTVHAAIDAAHEFLEANPLEGVTPHFAGGIIGTTAAANQEVERSDVELSQTTVPPSLGPGSIRRSEGLAQRLRPARPSHVPAACSGAEHRPVVVHDDAELVL